MTRLGTSEHSAIGSEPRRNPGKRPRNGHSDQAACNADLPSSGKKRSAHRSCGRLWAILGGCRWGVLPRRRSRYSAWSGIAGNVRRALPCKGGNRQNDCCSDNGESSNSGRAFPILTIPHATLQVMVPLRADGKTLHMCCGDRVVAVRLRARKKVQACYI